MGNIPVLKPQEVGSILKKPGFEMVRQRDISQVLLRQIAKDIGLTTDAFLKKR